MGSTHPRFGNSSVCKVIVAVVENGGVGTGVVVGSGSSIAQTMCMVGEGKKRIIVTL